MGKVVKATAKHSPNKPVAAAPTPEALAKVAELKAEAQQLFLKKDYAKASDVYEAAVKALPDGAAEKVDLWTKRVGCLLNTKRYKEAAKEASSILELAPGSAGALKARARAYEQQGLLKQALSDVQAVNRTEAATAETKDQEKRLKDAVAGRKDRPTTAPAGARAGASGAPANQGFNVKLIFGSETKIVPVDITVGYAELLDLAAEKYPNAGPVLLKFVDKEGDRITITSRKDVQTALTELLSDFQRRLQSAHAARLSLPAPPALRIELHPVTSRAAVPVPPPEELRERGKLNAVQDAQAFEPQEEWMADFARLFTDVTGLDPHAHSEAWAAATDKLNRGMQETVHREEADALFDEAGEHFQDSIVSGYIQWGNVHIMKAERKLHALQAAAVAAKDTEGAWLSGPGMAAVHAEYDATEAKIRAAMAVRPESWEAYGSLAQLEFERAKASIGYVVPLPSKVEDGKEPDADEAPKLVAAALASINKDAVIKAKASIEKTSALYEQALALAFKSYEAKKAKDAARAAAAAAAAGAPAPKEEGDNKLPMTSAPANVLIMHGNVLYDWSQVLASTGVEPWRPVLDAAAAKFRESGAPEPDVRTALKNHTRASELDLGPDPEPEVPTAPAPVAPAPAPPAAPAAPAAAPAPVAKGLPSLEVKKAKK